MAEKTITTSDAGRTIEVRAGQRVVLRLPDNPTTGFRWELDSHDGAMVEVGEGTFTRAGDGVGSGGVSEWTLLPKAPGTTSVSLKRWRPWEGERSVKERFAVTLAIAR